MAKKLHWKTRIKQKIEKWEKNLQSAGRKNRWSSSKNQYIKKNGKESWKIEEKRRKGLERHWKRQKDAKRYQIEKLKDKLDPWRAKRRKWKKWRKEIASGVRDSDTVSWN